MKNIKTFKTNLAFNMIGATVILLVIFSSIVSVIGYVKFTDSLTDEYNDSAFRTAETAATLINADKIDTYLKSGGNDDEYRLSLKRLDILCDKQNVTLIYAIAVDTSDYGRFTSVFNSVDKNSSYTRWEIGYVRETTNDEYKKVYKDIYENGLNRGTIVRNTNLGTAPAHITSLIPLKGTDGSVKAILCVQRPMAELKSGRRAYLKLVATTMIILSLIAALIIAIFIKRQFIKPVRKIVVEAERFASENNSTGEDVLKNISKINEINNLAVSIEKMEADTLSYIENLTSITAEKERIGIELQVASQIQEGSLPSIFPPYPNRKEFEIFASMTPAKEVGGDFYDFFLIDDDHLALVMADVSGKGVPAALFMMVTKILINERALMGGTPSEILTFVNDRICSNNKADMFVTTWLGILEISTGILKAANAGHEYPALQTENNNFELYKDKHGFVIGGIESAKYKDYELKLNSGDAIFLYTDGVTEATNSKNELFGNDRLVAALNKHPKASPQKILENVQNAIDTFVEDAPQFDDITMLALRYIGGLKNE